MNHSFAHWKIYISNRLTENEYANGQALNLIQSQANLCIEPHLHLAVSMRSFRAENLSTFVHELLNLNPAEATKQLERLRQQYPIYLTRNIDTAKRWLKSTRQRTLWPLGFLDRRSRQAAVHQRAL